MIHHRDRTFCIATCRHNRAGSDCEDSHEAEWARLEVLGFPAVLQLLVGDFAGICVRYETEAEPAEAETAP